jgi:hypothetical protein
MTLMPQSKLELKTHLRANFCFVIDLCDLPLWIKILYEWMCEKFYTFSNWMMVPKHNFFPLSNATGVHAAPKKTTRILVWF